MAIAYHSDTRTDRLTRDLEALPARLKQTLAVLDGAPPGVPELTLALLPKGSRTILAALGAVEIRETDEGAAVDVRVTSYGRDLIVACAASKAERAPGDLAELEARVRERLADAAARSSLNVASTG